MAIALTVSSDSQLIGVDTLSEMPPDSRELIRQTANLFRILRTPIEQRQKIEVKSSSVKVIECQTLNQSMP